MKTETKIIEWYNQLPIEEKRRLCHLHANHVIIDPSWGKDARDSIIDIWEKEIGSTEQQSENYKSNNLSSAMKTKQEILDQWLDNYCCDREKGYIDDYGVYPVIESAMEEYGNQIYNQAIEDAAKTIDDSRPYYPLVVKQSILKLKK